MKKVIFKVLKYFAYTLLALFITANLFVILSGRFYLYKGVANTYLVGETGPTIYDLDVFPYSTLKKGENVSLRRPQLTCQFIHSFYGRPYACDNSS